MGSPFIGKKFNTIREASESCNIRSFGKIGEVCIGKRKTSGGYRWSFITRNEVL